MDVSSDITISHFLMAINNARCSSMRDTVEKVVPRFSEVVVLAVICEVWVQVWVTFTFFLLGDKVKGRTVCAT